MQWFGTFVDEAVRDYRRSLDEKKANLVAEVEEFLKKASVSRRFSGLLGEMFVEQKLKDRAYTAKRTLGSTTPADVWALVAVNQQFFHLPIIQVKNSIVGGEPETLTRQEEHELLEFSGFVFRGFQQSQHVPQEFKEQPLVVSAGYVGISMKSIDFATAKWSGRYFGAHCHSALNDSWERHETWLVEMHALR